MSELMLMECERNALNGTRQLTFCNQKDRHIFMHCTEGCIAVTEDAFFDRHIEVFRAHGINCALPSEFVLSMRRE